MTSTATWTGTPTYTSTPVLTHITHWTVPLPEAIAIDPTNNNVFVGQSLGTTIGSLFGTTLGIYTSAGIPVTSYAASSSQMGQIGRIAGIAIDQLGNIFIVDNNENRVMVFDQNMNFIYQIGSSSPVTGGGPGEFSHPYGIVLDNNGSAGASIYVTDPGNSRVQKFTHSGTYITQIFPGNIGSIAVDGNNDVYVSANPPSQISKFDANGNPLTFLYAPELAVPMSLDPAYRGMAIDPSGNIYIAGGNYTYTRACLREFNDSWIFLGDTTASGDPSGSLALPNQVAIDGMGRIYLTDTANNSIEVYSP
ncbi:MAG TPA: 6-bladed beta-propeller [bacterium]|nr:6-bladed beta-propeller [bacterium]